MSTLGHVTLFLAISITTPMFPLHPPLFFAKSHFAGAVECPLCPMANNCQTMRDLVQPCPPDAVDIKLLYFLATAAMKLYKYVYSQ